MELTKNFKLAEFNCKSGQKVPQKFIANVTELAKNLQVLRDFIGKPIYITSGYRDSVYNKKVGGVKFSQHLTASASDIQVRDLKPTELYKIILDLMLAGKMRKGGLGLYSTFVHYDIRGQIVPFRGNI